MAEPAPTVVGIATPLADDLVARIARCGLSVEVLHEPALLPPTRYPNDHRGDPGFRRGAAAEQRWARLLARSEVLFGIPGDTATGLREVVRGGAPALRFVQATAAGAGEQVRAAGLGATELDRVAVCSSSGVHAGPLAEFAVAGLLAFTRDLARLDRDRGARRWDHYATRDLAGRTAVVLGTGAIGTRTAEVLAALGLRVVGVNTAGGDAVPPWARLVTGDDLAGVVRGQGDVAVLVVTVPATPATEGMVGADVLGALAPGAVLVNVGRGSVVDEAALVHALTSRLAGAALDVTATEPLPPDSPLWTLPNVVLSPHTAALSPHENDRIVDLFVDNLHRLAAGTPLRNPDLVQQFERWSVRRRRRRSPAGTPSWAAMAGTLLLLAVSAGTFWLAVRWHHPWLLAVSVTAYFVVWSPVAYGLARGRHRHRRRP